MEEKKESRQKYPKYDTEKTETVIIFTSVVCG